VTLSDQVWSALLSVLISATTVLGRIQGLWNCQGATLCIKLLVHRWCTFPSSKSTMKSLEKRKGQQKRTSFNWIFFWSCWQGLLERIISCPAQRWLKENIWQRKGECHCKSFDRRRSTKAPPQAHFPLFPTTPPLKFGLEFPKESGVILRKCRISPSRDKGTQAKNVWYFFFIIFLSYDTNLIIFCLYFLS